MCGIVGYVGSKNSTDVLVDGLRKLEYRGYDSAGIAVFEDGRIKIEKSKGRLDDLENKMGLYNRPNGHCGIGHTRWATHGEPSLSLIHISFLCGARINNFALVITAKRTVHGFISFVFYISHCSLFYHNSQ